MIVRFVRSYSTVVGAFNSLLSFASSVPRQTALKSSQAARGEIVNTGLRCSAGLDRGMDRVLTAQGLGQLRAVSPVAAHISTPEPASRASFPRAILGPVAGGQQDRSDLARPILPGFASTFSNPAVSWPDLRRHRPSSVRPRACASRSATRSARSGSTFTDCLAALEKAFFCNRLGTDRLAISP